MGIIRNREKFYLDTLARTQKSETVLSLIHSTYHTRNYDESSRKEKIGERLIAAYDLFRENSRNSDTGSGTYNNEEGQFESQYTIGHELGIWINSKLELNIMALKVALNKITIREYFDIVFFNYIQAVNGIVYNVLFLLLEYMQENDKLYLSKEDIKRCFFNISNSERDEVNGFFEMLKGTNFFEEYDNKTLKISSEYKIDELKSRCNLKFHKVAFEKVDEILETREKYSEYLIETVYKEENIVSNTKKELKEIEKQRIVFGAPGTGKSYLIDNDRKIFGINYNRITFHPNYTHSQFVGSYKPVSKLNKISNEKEVVYEFVAGPFLKVLVESLKDENEGIPHLLIIEEINRANPASVFGDIFQLLDRDNYGNSCYKVTVSKEMKEFLQSEEGLGNRFDEILGEDSQEIYIPNNMYIWATMNSADQGVYPMDSAFKRRWSFEYIGINNNESVLESKEYNIIQLKTGIDNYGSYKWNDVRKAINDQLKGKVNEDKLLGPYFLSESELKKGTIGNEEFDNIFKSKVLMYLYEDILKHKKNIKFFGKDVHSLSDIMCAYDEGKAFYFNIESHKDSNNIESYNESESIQIKDMQLAEESPEYNK